jgi:histidine ammonia-lyase
MQEDHVSMGWAAGRKLRTAIDGLSRVLAIEILTACRGIALRKEIPSPATAPVVALVNGVTGGPGPDKFLSPAIEAVVELVQTGRIVSTTEAVTGALD